MDEDAKGKVKKWVMILLWVMFVGGASVYFYDQEVKIGQQIPLLLAAQSLDSNELSYIYEADLSELYGANDEKKDIESGGVTIYMYENTKKSEWGRIIIYDRATNSLRYVIRTSAGTKIDGVATYDATSSSYISNDKEEESDMYVPETANDSCKISIVVRQSDKILYTLKNVKNGKNAKCNIQEKSGFELFPDIVHRLI